MAVHGVPTGMNNFVPTLPETQLRALRQAYRSAIAAKRLRTALGLSVLALCIIASGWTAEVDLAKLAANITNLTRFLGRLGMLDDGRPVWADLREWYWGLGKWTLKLGETVLIAYVGTVLGAAAAFLACFLAVGNLGVGLGVQFCMRRLLEVCRTVPEIVFALVFVVAFGLGPLPGVLAISIHSAGALGKLFAEVVENIDLKPVEGVIATGATWVQSVRFAVLPQVLSNFASYGLLRFEINVRGAAVMGFVGAGGIGQDLLEAIRKFYYSDISAMLLLIVLTVMLIDLGTERVRHRLLGEDSH